MSSTSSSTRSPRIRTRTRAAVRRRWGRVEALVGAEKRLNAVVADMLVHFDQRLEAIEGKAMIVCMSRRIAVEVYRRIVAARPDWHAASLAASCALTSTSV
jgi:type I site-specific restriction-modification system R (restriction) subunit